MKKSSGKKAKKVNLKELTSSIKVDLKQLDLSQLIRGEIQNFCLQLGLGVAEQFIQSEVEQLVGARYSREQQNETSRWGSDVYKRQVYRIAAGGLSRSPKLPCPSINT